MIINGKALIKAAPIKNMLTSKHIFNGVSHGLSLAGYDIRIAEDVFFGEHGVSVDGEWKTGNFTLASTIEAWDMPYDLVGVVHDKSTWARRGLAVFNTLIEPGWRGEALTLELVHHGLKPLHIKAGSGIAQVIFHHITEPSAYSGKYQSAGKGPQEAISEALD
jgi:dCTP deaminase